MSFTILLFRVLLLRKERVGVRANSYFRIQSPYAPPATCSFPPLIPVVSSANLGFLG